MKFSDVPYFGNLPDRPPIREMPIDRTKFNVEHLEFKVTVDSLAPEYVLRDKINRLTSPFIRGNQVKVLTDSITTQKHVYSKPASGVDWLKSIVVEWQPTLNFGWLRPRFNAFMVDVLKEEINHYFNICGSSDLNDRQTIEFLTTMPSEDYGRNNSRNTNKKYNDI